MNKVDILRVKGGFYNEQVNISLRESDKHRVTSIYGPNGSGKSSFSNAFLQYKLFGEEVEDNLEFTEVLLLNKDNTKVSLDDKERERMFIFSEKFIDEKINWDEDNLGAIVMFGDQVDIDTEIESERKKLDAFKDELKDFNIDIYEDPSTDPIKKVEDEIKASIKNTWTNRQKEIKGTKSANVTQTVFESVINVKKETMSKNKLLDNYNDRIREYKKINEDLGEIEELTYQINTQEKFNVIESLLESSLTKTVDTEMESALLNLIVQGHKDLIDNSKLYFMDENNNKCPYCIQDVSPEHRENLLISIKSILNEDVRNLERKLDLIFNEIQMHDIDVELYRFLDNDLVTEILKQQDFYNKKVEKLSEVVKDKLKNPFEALSYKIDITHIIDSLNTNYKNLNSMIIDYNESVRKRKDIEKELLSLNLAITRLEIDVHYKRYNNLLAEREYNLKKNEELNRDILKCSTSISNLEGKKNNVDIAMKEINKNLTNIFSGNNRIQLEIDEQNNYRVKSRNNLLKLKSLSTGERNVISLCYFFTYVKNKTNEKDKYRKSYFIILDDPISSLDFDNKLGIYGFLRNELDNIIINNDDSRVLILTHDLEVMFRLDKVFDDIEKSNGITKFYCSRRFLESKETRNIKKGSINSYRWNIESIFEYGNQKDDEDSNEDYYIGNILRKTLEAYSTFNYKNSFSVLTQSKDIINKIEIEEVREYFRNRMLRLMLHSESHTEERTKSIDYETFSEFSKSERVQTARDILCLLYLIDNVHIESYLSDSTKINRVKEWISDIESKQ